ncbi:MAG: tetratricopeptide repeat protein [Deltaproteobacteria bacterium]|nr:tetratricopeptide repeat protein [Deltaproteobacteria bacterium]
MDFNELADKIVSDLRSGSFAIWCGAGISIPSGLPKADDLVKALLLNTRLKPDEQERISEIVPSKLPFERLMEIVLGTMDNVAQKQLLDLFSIGSSSIFHQFLARLARLGMLKIICTTNFDTHIETALDDEGLKRGKDYDVYQSIEQFGEIDWNYNIIRVIKLHGSVELPEKLAVTVRRVASPGSVPQVHGPVRHVFGNGSHVGVLVMGYSFSDRFDISPVITQTGVSGSNKQIINLHFTLPKDKDFKIDKIKNDSNNIHPLAVYENHLCLYGDSEEVVKELCQRLGFNNLDISNPIPHWKSFLENFFKKLDERHNCIAGHYIAGSLLTMIGSDHDAIPYFAYVDDITKKAENDRWKLIALQSLAGAFIRVGDVDNGLNALRKAEPLASELEEGNFSDHVRTQFGSIYSQIGNTSFQHSLKFHNSALEVAKKSGDSMRCVPHLSGIADCWMKLGDIDAAKKAYEYALRIVENSGDLYRKAEVYGNIGSMAYILRDYTSALEWYEKAQKTSLLCGDTEREGIHTMNLANVYIKINQYENAFDCYSKARKILEGIWTNHSILQILDKHEQQAKRLFEKNQQSSQK